MNISTRVYAQSIPYTQFIVSPQGLYLWHFTLTQGQNISENDKEVCL